MRSPAIFKTKLLLLSTDVEILSQFTPSKLLPYVAGKVLVINS